MTSPTLDEVLVLVRRLSPTDRMQLTQYLLATVGAAPQTTVLADEIDDPWERLAQLCNELSQLPRANDRTLSEQLDIDRTERERSLRGC